MIAMKINTNPNIVKEPILPDGIGAQIFRKIGYMCYAYKNNLLFQDTKIERMFIHESDKIVDKDDLNNLLEKFSKVIIDPWSPVDFDSLENKVIEESCYNLNFDFLPFLDVAPKFNAIPNTKDNRVVIHIRRGNVVPGNTRWIDEDFYFDLLSNLDTIIKHLNIVNPEVVILTDAPDKDFWFLPDDDQRSAWNQDYLTPNSEGKFLIKSLDFTRMKELYPGLIIENKLSTYDAFIMMLNAQLLIISPSAFSKAAAALSKNKVISLDLGASKSYKNSVGYLLPNGSFVAK
ncbi:MAG: hypothetical protein RLZZ196_181 [Bacteroidota bacterium]|jgi:hypothetical protein